MARRRQEQCEAIPASLENAIEGMSVIDRGVIEGDDGELIPRVMLMFASETVAAWHHSHEETSRRIKAGWPQLSEGQLLEAMRSIRGRIRAALREAAPANKKRGWMDY